MSRGFRIWDTESECYLPVSKGGNDGVLGVTINGDGIIYLEDGEVNIELMRDGVIIEQDTGLKDKHGKRICEGDIVRLYGRFVSAITWQDNYCSFEWYNEEDGHCGLGKDNEEYYEVIGNIHENKELLGGEE